MKGSSLQTLEIRIKCIESFSLSILLPVLWSLSGHFHSCGNQLCSQWSHNSYNHCESTW